MRVLALDSTTERESVAIVEGGTVRGEVRLVTTDAHSRRLLPAVAFLLESLDLAPAGLDGFAVTTGPGSFTGLRVGLSTIQGLALATRRPCLGLSALDVLAARIVDEAPTLVAMVDAYRGQVYAAIYDADGRRRDGPVAEDPATFLRRVRGPAAFIGDGALRHRETIRAAHAEALFPRRSLFLAGTLGTMAEPRLERGEGTAPGALRPLYLREADIRKSAP